MSEASEPDIKSFLKKTTRGGITLSIGKIISSLISAIATIFVSRLLGANNYGIVSIACVPYTVALIIMNFGITPGLTRYISNFRSKDEIGKVHDFVSSALILQLLIGIIFSILIYLLSDFIANKVYHQTDLSYLIKISSIGVIGTSLFDTSFSIFMGYEKMYQGSITHIIYSILKAIIGPILIYIGYGPLGGMVGQVLPILLGGIISNILLLYNVEKLYIPKYYVFIDIIKELLIFGFPIYISSLLTSISIKYMEFLLPLYTNNDKIGNFYAANNFSIIISFFSLAIINSLYPFFSKLDYRNQDLSSIYNRTVEYTSFLLFPLINTTITLSDQISDILYANTYTYLSNYLMIFMLHFYVIGIGNISQRVLLNSQMKNNIYFKINAIKFVITIILSSFLIRYLEVYGIYIINIISLFLSTFIGSVYMKKEMNIDANHIKYFKIILISILSISITKIVLHIFFLNSWIEIMIGGVIMNTIFIALLIRFKVLGYTDVEIIDSILDLGNLNVFKETLLNIFKKLIDILNYSSYDK